MKQSRIPLLLVIVLVWVALTGLRPLPQQTPASSPIQVLAPAAPDPFGKLTPTNGATGVPTNNAVLRWSASSDNVTYQYCLRTNKNAACPTKKWISVGTNTSAVLQGLAANTTYWWQVRAVDSTGQITEADSGRWSFTTVENAAMPGYFRKLTPTDLQVNQPVNGLALTWSVSSGATSYQYCYDTRNNNLCDTAWTTAGGLSASLDGLAFGTAYYWQVRAVNAAGSVQADYGDWFSFQTVPAPGGAFGKTDPANHATEQPVDLTLTWALSEGTGITYEYCISTSPCTDSSAWTLVDTNLSVDLFDLQYETTYYWQVRAVNPGGPIYADDGTVWTFTTQVAPPAAFGKSSPGDGASGVPVSLNLTWSPSAGASSYEYCLSTVSCTSTSTWLLAGASTSVSVSGLAYNTPYYWQVRAINATGTSYANNGIVWQFTTQIAPPYAFAKLSPPDSDTPRVPPTLTLQWSPSQGATEYFYSVDTVSHPEDLNCSGPGWVSNGDSTESPHLSLTYNQVYYWQVCAKNSQGTMLADNGAWWRFTTLDAPPADFTKTSPLDEAIDQPLTPWLYWWTPTNPAATYEFSICTADPCPSPVWSLVDENAPIHITTPLPNGTIRYWQVRAHSGDVYTYANGGAWWSFTTVKAPPTSSDQAFSTPEDTPLTTKLSAENANYPLVFSLYGSQPAGGLAFHPDGSFTYTPVPNFNGVVTFQFVVTDGHNLPAGPFTATITVTGVNDPPVLAAIPVQAGQQGKELTFYAQATDPDLPYGDYLTYDTVETLPYGATIDPITGLFRWPIPPDQRYARFTFTVRVTDSNGQQATQPVNIKVGYQVTLPLITR